MILCRVVIFTPTTLYFFFDIYLLYWFFFCSFYHSSTSRFLKSYKISFSPITLTFKYTIEIHSIFRNNIRNGKLNFRSFDKLWYWATSATHLSLVHYRQPKITLGTIWNWKSLIVEIGFKLPFEAIKLNGVRTTPHLIYPNSRKILSSEIDFRIFYRIDPGRIFPGKILKPENVTTEYNRPSIFLHQQKTKYIRWFRNLQKITPVSQLQCPCPSILMMVNEITMNPEGPRGGIPAGNSSKTILNLCLFPPFLRNSFLHTLY